MRKLLLVLALAACGDPTGPLIPPPDKPLTDVSAAGKWVAPQVDVFWNVTLNLAVDGSTVTGTWQGVTQTANEIRRAPEPGEGRTRYGVIATGTHTGNAFALTLAPPGMPCGYGLVLALEHVGTALTGTARNLNCDGSAGVHVFPVTFRR